jgi:hypothetical protein
LPSVRRSKRGGGDLEMKTETLLRADKDAVVKTVACQKGEIVERKDGISYFWGRSPVVTPDTVFSSRLAG